MKEIKWVKIGFIHTRLAPAIFKPRCASENVGLGKVLGNHLDDDEAGSSGVAALVVVFHDDFGCVSTLKAYYGYTGRCALSEGRNPQSPPSRLTLQRTPPTVKIRVIRPRNPTNLFRTPFLHLPGQLGSQAAPCKPQT